MNVREFLKGDDKLRVNRMRTMRIDELDDLLGDLRVVYLELDPKGSQASIDPEIRDFALDVFRAGRLITAELTRRGL